MKRILLALALCLPVALISCGNQTTTTTPAPPQKSIQVVANALLTLGQSVASVQTAVINANAQTPKLLTDDQARAVLAVTEKIALAGKQATAITSGLAQLDPTNKTKLLAVFNPVIAAVNDSLSSGLITIKDPNTLNTIKTILVGVQATLSGVQLALQGAN